VTPHLPARWPLLVAAETRARKGRVSRLRLAYRVPDPLDTLEQWAIYHHHDLRHLSRAELEGERAQLRALLLLGAAVHPWHLERLRRVEEALRHATT
jgi:hypothetical protein